MQLLQNIIVCGFCIYYLLNNFEKKWETKTSAVLLGELEDDNEAVNWRVRQSGLGGASPGHPTCGVSVAPPARPGPAKAHSSWHRADAAPRHLRRGYSASLALA